jgi:excinuclease ABC subunit A
MGSVKIDMDFMEDLWVTCQQCHGKRFEPEILAVMFQGKNIFDVLNMEVREAIEFFQNQPKIISTLQVLEEVGLGYLPVGQNSSTLSGGEAQRIKLAKELARPFTGKTLYILDEPTTGLHFHDLKQLLQVLERLISHDNTIVVIEHNIDFSCTQIGSSN